MRFTKQNIDVEPSDILATKLKAFLVENKAQFEHSLIPNMDHIDHRALNEKGIEILEVNYLVDNRYSLVYQYDWFIFSGCTNTDESGMEKNKVTITLLDNGDLEFDRSALGIS
ncbi:hypothetical protein HC725_12245 [Vibrio sp. S17_S38]|uniref:hypothetical protein n=1 Tax=Vibrio sp. S17_S38 TaxID=2720229 RepID=UPI0016808EF4|nr:hypothetical protein [Vibrio sp. S17_S38]MBD1574037.1 hypothetical protein [Vibrio sp. S17_S38]